jgi:hypothetical protein
VKESSVKERRAHHRHPANVAVHGSNDECGAAARMVARNLSLGGLQCTSPVDFPEMTRLAVRLMLPLKNGKPAAELEPLDVQAVVVRREEVSRSAGRASFALSLYFTSLSGAAKERLQRFLEGAA